MRMRLSSPGLWLAVALLCAGVSLIAAKGSQDTNAKVVTPQTFHLDWLSINPGGVADCGSSAYKAGLSSGQAVSGVCESPAYRVRFGFWQAGVTVPLGVEEVPADEPIATFQLRQNYPNPFNPNTVIEFTIPYRCQVTVVVYNVLGQRVATVVDEPLAKGPYKCEWQGRDDAGARVATGIYFYRLYADDFTQTRKMLLLR
jgi:hypothetical protein